MSKTKSRFHYTDEKDMETTPEKAVRITMLSFDKNEKDLANNPMTGGPFKPFLNELYKVQQSFPTNECPVRIALVTARSAPSHERVIKTLREWNIRIDESLFLEAVLTASFTDVTSVTPSVFFIDLVITIFNLFGKGRPIEL